MVSEIAKFLIIFGIVLVVIGIAIFVFSKLGFRGLPGDIYIEKNNFVFFFPVVSSIIISIILSILISIIFNIFLKK